MLLLAPLWGSASRAFVGVCMRASGWSATIGLLIVRPSIHPKHNLVRSIQLLDRFTTGGFQCETFWVDNPCLFHFSYSICHVCWNRQRTDNGLLYLITWPSACHYAANVGAMQVNATFYQGNVKPPFNYWFFGCCWSTGTRGETGLPQYYVLHLVFFL